MRKDRKVLKLPSVNDLAPIRRSRADRGRLRYPRHRVPGLQGSRQECAREVPGPGIVAPKQRHFRCRDVGLGKRLSPEGVPRAPSGGSRGARRGRDRTGGRGGSSAGPTDGCRDQWSKCRSGKPRRSGGTDSFSADLLSSLARLFRMVSPRAGPSHRCPECFRSAVPPS